MAILNSGDEGVSDTLSNGSGGIILNDAEDTGELAYWMLTIIVRCYSEL